MFTTPTPLSESYGGNPESLQAYIAKVLVLNLRPLSKHFSAFPISNCSRSFDAVSLGVFTTYLIKLHVNKQIHKHPTVQNSQPLRSVALSVLGKLLQ